MVTYKKDSQYTVYPAVSFREFIDFLYVDSVFFENNIPITGATLDTIVTRSGDMGIAWLSIYIVTYYSGLVGQELIAGGMWNIGDTTFSFHHDLSTIFYGMGLNALDIRISPQIFYSPMIWDVHYTLGVS
jgi:hypothetical protein